MEITINPTTKYGKPWIEVLGSSKGIRLRGIGSQATATIQFNIGRNSVHLSGGARNMSQAQADERALLLDTMRRVAYTKEQETVNLKTWEVYPL